MTVLDLVYIPVAAAFLPRLLNKRRGGWGERFGDGEIWPRTAKPRVLLHAVSVGEVNALRALVTNGPYYSCVISPKNGQMTIDFAKPVPVVGVTLRELEKSWRPAQHYRRGFAVSELESWPWEAVVEFPAGLSIACEVFEENATAGGITIPPVIGLPDQRTLLATLVHCEYNHPPEQSPSRGTVAVFGFEIVPATLRK